MKKFAFLMSLFLCLGINGVNAQETILNFNDTNGAVPRGGLTVIGNNLYGMPFDDGNIFSVHKDGSGFRKLHNFGGINLTGSLTLEGGKFFGETEDGGSGSGSVFSIDTNGSNYRDLYDFSFNVDGTNPLGNVTYSSGVLYGMTCYGQSYSVGTVFSIDTDGTHYTQMLIFNRTNGANPNGSLTLSGNVLYGMTANGGANNDGVIFSIHTDGTHYKDLYDFNNINGGHPTGSLTLAGKKLYGMTSAGGANGNGVIFSIDTNGNNYNDLVNFNGTNGAEPYGSLTLEGDTLFGMTSAGGASGGGVIFSIDTSGNGYTVIGSFDGTNGSSPQGDLTYSSGVLYGMTSISGSDGLGTIFRYPFCKAFTVTHYSSPDNGSGNGVAAVSVNGGVLPYTYSWSPGGQTTDTVKGLSAGTYTCTITNNNGCEDTATIIIQSTAGINNIAVPNTSITAYPNPSNGIFTLIDNAQLTMPARPNRSDWDNEGKSIEVYNVLGEKVYSQFSIVHFPLSIDLSNQPTGVYFYRVMAEDGSLAGQGKLIIQK